MITLKTLSELKTQTSIPKDVLARLRAIINDYFEQDAIHGTALDNIHEMTDDCDHWVSYWGRKGDIHLYGKLSDDAYILYGYDTSVKIKNQESMKFYMDGDKLAVEYYMNGIEYEFDILKGIYDECIDYPTFIEWDIFNVSNNI